MSACNAWRACFLLVVASTAGTAMAGPSQGRIYLSEIGTGRLHQVSYDYDGAGGLTLGDATLVAQLPRGGGLVQVQGSVYVTGAGVVLKVNPKNGTYVQATSGNNANTCAPDPQLQSLYCGWTDSLAIVPLAPFGNGAAVGTTGDDTLVTAVAFTPSNGVFYTTGEIVISGNFGSLQLPARTTSRLHTAILATGVNFDPFNGKLLVAGVGRAKQIDPANPGVIAASRDDSATENYLTLTPNGKGHAFGTRLGDGRIVLLDYAADGDINSENTILVSVAIAGVSNLSGQAALDFEYLFSDGFEQPAAE